MSKSNHPDLPVVVQTVRGNPSSGYARIYGKRFPFRSAEEKSRAIQEAEGHGLAQQSAMIERAKREQGRDGLSLREKVSGRLDQPRPVSCPTSIVPGSNRPPSEPAPKVNPYTALIRTAEIDSQRVNPKKADHARRMLEIWHEKSQQWETANTAKVLGALHDQDSEVVRGRAHAQKVVQNLATNPDATSQQIADAEERLAATKGDDFNPSNYWASLAAIGHRDPEADHLITLYDKPVGEDNDAHN